MFCLSGHRALVQQVVLLLASLELPASAEAQSKTAREETSRCTSCQIVLDPVITITGGAGGVRFVDPLHAARDSRGTYYISDPRAHPGIFVFDSTGAFVRFLSPPPSTRPIRAFFVGIGDTVHAFADREYLFDRNGLLIRSRGDYREITTFSAAGLTNGNAVLNATVMSPELFGFDLQLFDSGGRLLGAFGIEPGESRDLDSFARFRALCASTGGAFWSGPRNAYVLTLRDSVGDVRRTIRRNAPWFASWASWDSRYDVAPPPPRLMSIHEDQRQRLWTLSLVAASAWTRSARRPRGGEAPMAAIDELLRANDSMIEVIDVETGQLIVSRRIPKLILRFLPSGLAMELGRISDGAITIRFSRLRMVEPR